MAQTVEPSLEQLKRLLQRIEKAEAALSAELAPPEPRLQLDPPTFEPPEMPGALRDTAAAKPDSTSAPQSARVVQLRLTPETPPDIDPRPGPVRLATYDASSAGGLSRLPREQIMQMPVVAASRPEAAPRVAGPKFEDAAASPARRSIGIPAATAAVFAGTLVAAALVAVAVTRMNGIDLARLLAEGSRTGAARLPPHSASEPQQASMTATGFGNMSRSRLAEQDATPVAATPQAAAADHSPQVTTAPADAAQPPSPSPSRSPADDRLARPDPAAAASDTAPARAADQDVAAASPGLAQANAGTAPPATGGASEPSDITVQPVAALSKTADAATTPPGSNASRGSTTPAAGEAPAEQIAEAPQTTAPAKAPNEPVTAAASPAAPSAVAQPGSAHAADAPAVAGDTATGPAAISEQASPAPAPEADGASGSPGALAVTSASDSSQEPPRLVAGPAPRSTNRTTVATAAPARSEPTLPDATADQAREAPRPAAPATSGATAEPTTAEPAPPAPPAASAAETRTPPAGSVPAVKAETTAAPPSPAAATVLPARTGETTGILLAVPAEWVLAPGDAQPLPFVLQPAAAHEGRSILLAGLEAGATVGEAVEIIEGTWLIEATALARAKVERGPSTAERALIQVELRSNAGQLIERAAMILFAKPQVKQ